MGLYVQYGCGMSAPTGWRNFDSSPTARFEALPIVGRFYTKNHLRFPANVEYGDIVKGLPLRQASCDAVYCSHVLEHLSLVDLRTALRKTYLILKDKGKFRLVMPDLEAMAKAYVFNPSEHAALEFMRDTGLGLEHRPRGFVELIKNWFGNSAHLWLWDYRSLAHELSQAGFHSIRRAEYGDSEEPAFLQVESKVRWQGCLGIEATR